MRAHNVIVNFLASYWYARYEFRLSPDSNKQPWKDIFYAIGENLNIDYLLNDIKEVIIFDITMTTLVLKEMLAY